MTAPTVGADGNVDAVTLDRAHQAVSAAISAGRLPAQTPTGNDALDALVVCAQACGIEIAPERIATARHARPATVDRAASLLGLVLRPVDIATSQDWSKADAAGLVALIADRWIALVPQRGRMWLVDPAAGGQSKLQAADLATLGPAAWQVCAAFPDRECGLTDIGRITWSSGGRRDLRIVVGCALVAAVLGMIVPLLSGRIVGTLIPGRDSERVMAVAAVLILVAAAAAVLLAAQVIICQRMVIRMDQRVTVALYSRLFQLSARFHRNHQPGELAQRIAGLGAVSVAFAGAMPVAISAASLVLGSLLVLFWLDLLAGLVTTLISALIFAAGVFLVRWLTRAAYRYNQASLELAGQTFAMLTGIGKIRAADAGDRMYARWLLAYARQQRWARLVGTTRIRLGLIAAVPAAAVSLVIVIIFTLGIDKSGLGAFTSMTAAATQVAGGVTTALVAMATVAPVLPFLAATRPILASRPDVPPASAGEPGELTGQISIRDLTFRYSSKVPVLDGIGLEIEPGTMTAVVGPSGSGKTTLVRLLLGLETPDSGMISFDGRSLEQLDRTAVRRQIGVVPQNAALATGSILDNILSGMPDLAESDAWRAAELVGLADDIRQLPMGMRTVISDGAETFSGGQRQRIMLARVMARNPRVVVLDEATSALDNLSQSVVTDALLNLGTTRIVVAHRLSTIRHADQVVVLVDGKVAQTGTFDELAGVEGEFAQLVRLQQVE